MPYDPKVETETPYPEHLGPTGQAVYDWEEGEASAPPPGNEGGGGDGGGSTPPSEPAPASPSVLTDPNSGYSRSWDEGTGIYYDPKGNVVGELPKGVVIPSRELGIMGQSTSGETNIRNAAERFARTISEESVTPLTVMFQISAGEARRLAALAAVAPKSAELRNLTKSEIASLKAAAHGRSIWEIAPTEAKEGRLPGVMPTPELQEQKVEDYDKAIGFLKSKGLIDKEGSIKAEAILNKSKDIRQALLDVGVTIRAIRKYEGEVKAAEAIERGQKQIEEEAEDLRAWFEASHIKLADDNWVPIKEWNKLSKKYQDIGKQKGFEPMLEAIEEDESRGTLAGNLKRAEQASGWLDKARAFLGLTPDDIVEAEARYLTAPPMPEATEEKANLSARQMLSLLVPTLAEQPVEPRKASFTEILRAMVEVEKKKVELFTTGASLSLSQVSPSIRGKIETFAESLPKGLEQAIKFGGALTLGALSAPVYSAIVTGHLVQASWGPDKVKRLKDLGMGMANFIISIPSTVAAEPALALGEYTGLFVVGPEGMAKIVKEIGARGVPSYIPSRGMGIEYSVVKIPTKIANREAIVAAVNEGITRAMRSKTGEAVVKIGDGSLKLKIKSTPVSEIVGPALYHATPALTDALKKGQVKGALYTSPHLAVRFAESSASGTPQTNPAILMIFSKDGKVKWSPTTNLYKGAKEMEAVYENTKLEPVKSLWNRLTFGKAGDFITTYKGEIIPIYRFKEPGAIAPRINLTDLVTIRLKTMQASLLDLVAGKKGFRVIKETAANTKEAITRRVISEAKKEIKKGKNTTEAYDIAFRRETERLVKPYIGSLERLYRVKSERFERAYLRNLQREIELITRERPFIAGERLTRIERQQLESGVIPQRLRELQPKEERITARIEEPRISAERLTPERAPTERVPPERPSVRRTPPERIPIRRPPERRAPTERVPTRRPPPEKVPPTKAIPLKGKDLASQWTPEEIKSAIAWKDGFVVHALKAPYRRGIDETTYHIKNVPKGLDYLDLKKTGPGSQQASARVMGRLPGKLTVDVGNQDVVLTPARGNRVRMQHVRDTRGTQSRMTVNRGHSISKKRGRVYHTNIGGSTVISRRPIGGY